MSVNIEYSSKEVSGILLENIFKMLQRRNTIKKIDKFIEDLVKPFVEKGIVDFKDDNNKKYSINLTSGKLASIVQGSQLDEYLKSNIDVHKIVVMREPSKKVVKQIMVDYPNSEIFLEHEFMEDIPSKFFIPEHQLLTEEEKQNILNTFKETELAKINDTDVMSRHFDAKPGDIFRIIRSSITAGKNIFYRRVVSGNINQLFDN